MKFQKHSAALMFLPVLHITGEFYILLDMKRDSYLSLHIHSLIDYTVQSETSFPIIRDLCRGDAAKTR